jgi:division protein CdvB (Snf7/Vps24/ESCRT-III family)
MFCTLFTVEDVNLSERFAKKWETKRDTTPFTISIKETVVPPAPLKSRLDNAIRRLELQIHKLDQSSDRFSQKDRALFTKIVAAYEEHDTAHANIYANELAEVRKMERLVMNSRLALDQVLLRMRTVTEFGDLVTTLGPCISVLRSVNVGLCGVLPEAENELGDIGNMLSGLMFDCGTSAGMSLNFNNVNEDAAKILAEAATVAEQKINAKLPDLPPGLSTNSLSSNATT